MLWEWFDLYHWAFGPRTCLLLRHQTKGTLPYRFYLPTCPPTVPTCVSAVRLKNYSKVVFLPSGFTGAPVNLATLMSWRKLLTSTSLGAAVLAPVALSPPSS